jgi:hypothetical protein
MDNENLKLESALYKVYNSLYVKDRVDFYVKLSPHKFDVNSYKVSVFFIIDQSKYWKSSPLYSEEYFDFVTQVLEDGDVEEELDELTKYVIHSKLAFVHKFFEHSNMEVYRPLINAIEEMDIPVVVKLPERKPYPEIILDERSPSTVKEVQTELNNEFNLEDILIYFDKI